MPPPPPFFQNVPRFCFLRFMYPGTWNFVSSSNPCTVHGILFFLQIQMNLRKQNLGTFWKKVVGGGSAPKKISVLFRFLPTLKNNLIFWKKSKSRCSSTDKKWENKVERVSILMGHPVYHQKPSVLVLELFRSFSHFFWSTKKTRTKGISIHDCQYQVHQIKLLASNSITCIKFNYLDQIKLLASNLITCIKLLLTYLDIFIIIPWYIYIPYVRHHRPLLIRSRSWIQAIHKAKGHSTLMVFGNGDKSIQAAAYNGTRTVPWLQI